MIGFYDYTVILTYLSLAISLFGITQSMNGRFHVAIICLALSGLCDMFDGKIARTKKNRTDDEKSFGIQIDSLCDVICFGIFPAIICYNLAFQHVARFDKIFGTAAIIYYGICSVIRLAFFNVLEGNRQRSEGGANKYYRGLPITTMSIVLPIVFLLSFWIPANAFKWVLFLVLIVVGTLFILNFRLRKPNNMQLTVIVAAVAVVIIVFIVLYWLNRHRDILVPNIPYLPFF